MAVYSINLISFEHRVFSFWEDSTACLGVEQAIPRISHLIVNKLMKRG